MEKRFVGKVALVTGATNGIGQATAVRLAAEKGDRRTAEQLRSILQQARESIRLGDTSTFSDLDIEFHRVIWTSTNNSLAARIGELRFRGAFEEHSAIYRAIRDGDPKAAVIAMRKHIRNAGTALARASSENASAIEQGSTPDQASTPGQPLASSARKRRSKAK